MTTKKQIMILAGESSGDVLASNLINQLSEQASDITFSGMGGRLMKEAGAHLIVDNSELDIIGFTEIISKLPLIRRAYKAIKQHILSTRPELVILVDYPGFNLKMARLAKKAGCKVLYYVSPQIWAWRYQRIKKIKRYVDHMAVLFPFEKTLYDKESIPATYVGHPLARQVEITLSTLKEKETNKQPSIALLPGSRKKEIKQLLPLMVEAAEIIHKQHPDIHFVLPVANNIQPEMIQPFLPDYIHMATDNHYQHIASATSAICTSGTVTLETALLGTPHVIVYKSSWLNYQLGKRLVKSSHIGLSNIVAQQCLAPELIQHEVSAQRITQKLTPMLTNKKYHKLIQKKYTQLLHQFNRQDGHSPIASIAIKLLSE